MDNATYWQKRALQRLVTAEVGGLDMMSKVLPLYDQALVNINKEINKLYANYADEVGLDVKELTTILVGADKNDFLKNIRKSMKSLGFNVGDIYNKNYLDRITRLEALKQQIYWQIKELSIDVQKVQDSGYKKIIEESYKSTSQDLREQLGASAGFATIDPRITNQLLREKWQNGNYKTRTYKNTEKFATGVRDVIGGGLLSGISEEKMRRQLREKFDTGKYETMRLIRTEVNYFENQSELQSYLDEGVTHYRYEAVMDGITSEICKEHNGEVYPVMEAVVGTNYPPLHPNCRSTTVVAFKSEYTEQQAERDTGDNRPYHRRDLENVEDLEEARRVYLESTGAVLADRKFNINDDIHDIRVEELRVPQTVNDLIERWGEIEATEEGLESIRVKLAQGGDKALNTEAEWIGQRAKFTGDKGMQLRMEERLDFIIGSIFDDGQRGQVEMVKKYLDFPSESNTVVFDTVDKLLSPLIDSVGGYDTVEEFVRDHTAEHLMDLSDRDKDRFGRIWETTGEVIQDAKDMADMYGSRGVNQYQYERGANVPDVDSKDEMITIYRGVTENADKIEAGDFVTFSEEYAKQHIESNLDEGKVIKMAVPARDVIWQGNDLTEWIYSPAIIREKYPTMGSVYETFKDKAIDYSQLSADDGLGGRKVIGLGIGANSVQYALNEVESRYIDDKEIVISKSKEYAPVSKGTVGFYDSATKLLWVREENSPEGLIDSFVHEFGHAVDSMKVPDGINNPDRIAEWRLSSQQDFLGLPQNERESIVTDKFKSEVITAVDLSGYKISDEDFNVWLRGGDMSSIIDDYKTVKVLDWYRDYVFDSSEMFANGWAMFINRADRLEEIAPVMFNYYNNVYKMLERREYGELIYRADNG